MTGPDPDTDASPEAGPTGSATVAAVAGRGDDESPDGEAGTTGVDLAGGQDAVWLRALEEAIGEPAPSEPTDHGCCEPGHVPLPPTTT